MSIEQKDTGYFYINDTNDLQIDGGFPVSNRLRMLQKLLKLKSVSAFASEIGVDASVLNNIMSPYGRKGKPSFDTLEKIAVRYSRVNIEWLVTGKGEPLRPFATATEVTIPNTQTQPKDEASAGHESTIQELRAMLLVCQAEKEGLQKLLAVKDDLITLLKEKTRE